LHRAPVVTSNVKLRNRDGSPVDPVPFLVVALLGVLLCLSYGPGYLLAWGVPLWMAVAASAAVGLALAAGSYYWYVWRARPELQVPVPADFRMKRLAYGALILAVVLVGLALPLFAR
jgi:hypothetical protein